MLKPSASFGPFVIQTNVNFNQLPLVVFIIQIVIITLVKSAQCISVMKLSLKFIFILAWLFYLVLTDYFPTFCYLCLSISILLYTCLHHTCLSVSWFLFETLVASVGMRNPRQINVRNIFYLLYQTILFLLLLCNPRVQGSR